MIILKIIIVIAVIFALKWLWVAISTCGQGSFDGEKSEILRRRNYLAGKLITSPVAVLNEMPDGIGSQFKVTIRNKPTFARLVAALTLR